jgi:hypothetical protein
MDMKTIQVLVVILFAISKLTYAFNSYVYLPDKYIQEEIPIGSLIADMSEEMTNYQQQQQGSKSARLREESEEHYTFLEDTKSSIENTYFLLDSITGRVTSKRYLDRESMCMNKHCMNQCDYFSALDSSSQGKNQSELNCKMNLKILTIPSYEIISLNVIIQDINDNKPQFRIDYLNQSIAENVPIGYRIPIDLAYDPDIGQNSVQSYELIHATNANEKDFIRETFELTTSLNESQFYLIVKHKLDREKVHQYNLTISACDGGTPSNCGLLKLVLHIVDINDHNPMFMKDSYTFTVMENMAAGTVIGQINAIDLDDDLNGQIRYSLVNNGLKAFHLDSSTGMLILNEPLDYEREKSFSFNVEARDCGVGSLPAYVPVEINVLDLNDNAPEVSVSFLNSLERTYVYLANNQTTLNVYMNENSEANKFLAHVSISDKDSNENAEIEWRVYVNDVLEQSNKDGESRTDTRNSLLKVTALNKNSFTLSTGNVILDREMMPVVNVSMIVRDKGQVPRNNLVYYNFSLVLVDQNDNAPQFDQRECELSIDENNQIDQFVHKFNAIDADEAENGQVTYSLDKENQLVYVESHTGILRASHVFDKELVDKYEFSVVARDNSKQTSERRETKLKCVLSVNNLNDNAPRIFYNSSGLPYREYSNKSHLILRIDENTSPLTQLVKFSCDDADNEQVGFGLLNMLDKAQLPFKVSQDGRFYVASKLDRETQDFYELDLVCFDQLDPNESFNKVKETKGFNSTLRITVRLSDINDNCPRNLNAAGSTRNSADIVSQQRLDKSKWRFVNRDNLSDVSSLFQEQYVDADLGKNGELKFDLQTHADLFELRVNEEKVKRVYTLNVRLLAHTNAAFKLGRYVIKVRISDNGNPSCHKNELFVLYVGDNETRNEQELVERMNALFLATSNNKNTDTESPIVQQYVNDQNGDVDSQVLFKLKNKLVVNNYTTDFIRSTSTLLLMNNDYMVLFFLVTTLVIIGVLMSSLGVIYIYRNYRSKRSRASAVKRTNDFFKQYHNGDLDDTSRGNSSHGDDANEINNLLGENHESNRLSSSFKSHSEQSNSGDSAETNLADTSSNGSTNLDQHQQARLLSLVGSSTIGLADAKSILKASHVNTTTTKASNTLKPKFYDQCDMQYAALSTIDKMNRNKSRANVIYASQTFKHTHQQQTQADNKNLTFLTSFPQKLQKYQCTNNSNQLLDQIHCTNNSNANNKYGKKHVPLVPSSSSSNSSSSSTNTTQVITPISSCDGSEIIIMPTNLNSASLSSSSAAGYSASCASSTNSPSSISPPQVTFHHPQPRLSMGSQSNLRTNFYFNNNIGNNVGSGADKFFKSNSNIRDYVRIAVDEDESSHLFVANENTNNTMNRSNSRLHHYLRSSAV